MFVPHEDTCPILCTCTVVEFEVHCSVLHPNRKNVGDLVNLEADCIGKYAAAAVGGLRERVDGLEERLRVAQAVAGVAFLAAATCSYLLAKKR